MQNAAKRFTISFFVCIVSVDTSLGRVEVGVGSFQQRCLLISKKYQSCSNSSFLIVIIRTIILKIFFIVFLVLYEIVPINLLDAAIERAGIPPPSTCLDSSDFKVRKRKIMYKKNNLNNVEHYILDFNHFSTTTFLNHSRGCLPFLGNCTN